MLKNANLKLKFLPIFFSGSGKNIVKICNRRFCGLLYPAVNPNFM